MLRSLVGSEMCIRDRSYIVETDEGRSFIRGRRLLKPHSDVQDPTPDTLQPVHPATVRTPTHTEPDILTVPQVLQQGPTMPRRSPRTNKGQLHHVKKTYTYSGTPNSHVGARQGGWGAAHGQFLRLDHLPGNYNVAVIARDILNIRYVLNNPLSLIHI